VLRSQNGVGTFQTSVLGYLAQGEAISFANGSPSTVNNGTTPLGTNSTAGATVVNDSLSMSMTVQVAPENGIGIMRHYGLTRSILLERP
jgi:hypothetical protein